MKSSNLLYIVLSVIVSITSGGKFKSCTPVFTLIKETSSSSGFDENDDDFDILRELIEFVGIRELLSKDGLKSITVFAPTDLAFYRLAMNLGYNDDYDESDIFDYIAKELSEVGDLVEVVENILFYHVIDESIEYNELEKGMALVTFLDDMTLEVRGDPEDKNVRLKHEADEDTFSYPKIDVDRIDIETCNGLVHVIEDVLNPLPTKEEENDNNDELTLSYSYEEGDNKDEKDDDDDMEGNKNNDEEIKLSYTYEEEEDNDKDKKDDNEKKDDDKKKEKDDDEKKDDDEMEEKDDDDDGKDKKNDDDEKKEDDNKKKDNDEKKEKDNESEKKDDDDDTEEGNDSEDELTLSYSYEDDNKDKKNDKDKEKKDNDDDDKKTDDKDDGDKEKSDKEEDNDDK